MIHQQDLRQAVISKLRTVGFNVGTEAHPYVTVSVQGNQSNNNKDNSFIEIELYVDIVAIGKDEINSNINNLQELAEDTLDSVYTGESHAILFKEFGIVQYLDEDDEKYNIYRRLIPCTFLVQRR